MKQPEEGREWVRQWTASVAKTLQTARGKMSAQQLSNRCAELGYPIPRSTITNLEIGRKESVSLQEVVVLAKALDIPPLQLVYPLGRDRTIEVLPGTTIPTQLAAEWFTGEGAFPVALEDGAWGANGPEMRAWKSGIPLQFRELRKLQDQWNRARSRLVNAQDSGDRDGIELAEEQARVAEDQLLRHRLNMRIQGLDPGEPPLGISDLDDEGVG